MEILIGYLAIVLINHLLMFRLCRVLGPAPKNERSLLVFFMCMPVINVVTLAMIIFMILFGHDKALFSKFYNMIFNGDKDV